MAGLLHHSLVRLLVVSLLALVVTWLVANITKRFRVKRLGLLLYRLAVGVVVARLLRAWADPRLVAKQQAVYRLVFAASLSAK